MYTLYIIYIYTYIPYTSLYISAYPYVWVPMLLLLAALSPPVMVSN